jgi:hypothetical protein
MGMTNDIWLFTTGRLRVVILRLYRLLIGVLVSTNPFETIILMSDMINTLNIDDWPTLNHQCYV